MATFADFSEHPWTFDEALAKGLFRAFGHKAVDGDTCDVICDGPFRVRMKVRLRLRGVDTPEIYGVHKGSEEWEAGEKARERVAQLIEGQPLLIDSGKDTGKYGRWISEVYVGINGDSPGQALTQILRNEGHTE